MSFVNALIARISQDEEGQGLAEYALILALIAIVAIVALIFLGGQISGILNTVGDLGLGRTASSPAVDREVGGRRRHVRVRGSPLPGGPSCDCELALSGVLWSAPRGAPAPGQRPTRHGGR